MTMSQQVQLAVLTAITVGVKQGVSFPEVFHVLAERNTLQRKPLWEGVVEHLQNKESIADLFAESFDDGVSDILAVAEKACDLTSGFVAARDYLRAVVAT